MNLQLIFKLSLFALAMGISTDFVLRTQIEPLFWLLIFLLCARTLARKAGGRLFLHGVLLGLANSVWVTAAHILFLKQYVAFNPEESAWVGHTSMQAWPRLAMVAAAPVSGLIFGCVIVGMAWAAGRFVRPATVVTTA